MIMPKRRRSKRWISWLIFLVLLIVAGVVCYLVWNNYFNDNKKDGQGGAEISEEAEEGNNIVKSDGIDEDDEKKVKQYEGNDPNEAGELSGVVTYANVMDDKVTIRVNIDQYLSDGSCELSLMSGDFVAYEETTKIVSAASTSTCEGFDISLSKIGRGAFSIIIKLSADNKTGVVKGEVSI